MKILKPNVIEQKQFTCKETRELFRVNRQPVIKKTGKEIQVKKFRDLLDNKPVPGQILTVLGNEQVKLKLQESNKGVFLPNGKIITAYVNIDIDKDGNGWFINNELNGYRCLILPEELRRLFEVYNGRLEDVNIITLRVEKYNKKETALLCTVV